MVELPTVTIIGGVILFLGAIYILAIALKVFRKDSLLEQTKSCFSEG